MSAHPSITQVGQALLATLRAGTFEGASIRANLTDGGEVRPPAVIVTSPAIGFEVLAEGFVVSQSVWGLLLYSGNGREASTGVELAFLQAVIEALADDSRLGGAVSGCYLEPTDSATAEATGVDSDGNPTGPMMYRRALRLHVDH